MGFRNITIEFNSILNIDLTCNNFYNKCKEKIETYFKTWFALCTFW